MTETSNRQRLRECFRAVFPAAASAEIDSASALATEGWDSVAQVTLVTLVEEEFGIAIPPERYGDLTSFASFLALVGE